MTGSLSLVSLTDSGSSFPFATTAPFFASPTEQQHNIRERANRASAFLALRGSDAPRKDSMGT
jgi:hypothetical protein